MKAGNNNGGCQSTFVLCTRTVALSKEKTLTCETRQHEETLETHRSRQHTMVSACYFFSLARGSDKFMIGENNLHDMYFVTVVC